MSKVGESLLKGVKEALAYAEGKQMNAKAHQLKTLVKVDVRSIREDLAMSREKFASTFGFSLRTLEKWEQGARIPEGPTRAYLFVIKSSPEAVKSALIKYRKKL